MDQHLKKFFDLSLDLFCIANPQGYFIEVNPAFSRTVGWTKEELLSRPLLEFVHAEDQEKTLSELERLNRGLPTIAFENRFRCLTGEYRNLAWNAFPDAGTELLYAAARDVTDKKLSEKKLREMASSLQHKILQLNDLIDTGIDIIRIDQEESLLDLALRRATALTDATRGLVYITKPDGSMEQIAFPAESAEQEKGSVDIIQSGFACLGHQYTFMVIGKENRHKSVRFETVDKMLLHLISQQVRTAIENKFYVSEMLEKQRLTRELELASAIQNIILPTTLPVISGYQSSGLNIPSKEVGGDYYEIIPLPNGRFALIIADVAGKGVYSGLLVNSLHAALHAYLESGIPLADLGQRLNQLMFDVTTAMLFITCFIALLDPKTGNVEYLNAGHMPPQVIRKEGGIENPSAGGPPLGCVREGITYATGSFQLGRGDGLLLYTDGISEASNPAGEFYQKSGRFERILPGLGHADKGCGLEEIIADVRDFSGSDHFDDDITMLFLRREDGK